MYISTRHGGFKTPLIGNALNVSTCLELELPAAAECLPGARRELGGERRSDSQAESADRPLALDQLADRLNQSGEHIPLPPRRARAV